MEYVYVKVPFQVITVAISCETYILNISIPTNTDFLVLDSQLGISKVFLDSNVTGLNSLFLDAAHCTATLAP